MLNVKKMPKLKPQTGFSLVELLVVVAIIAVLAAAGIISYTKYISSSQDTVQETNAAAIANALKTAQIARSGGLTAADTGCLTTAVSSATTTIVGATNSIQSCAVSIANNGNFVSPYLNTVTGSTYITATSATTPSSVCNGTASANNALVLWGNASGFFVSACNKTGVFVKSTTSSTQTVGVDTFQFMGASDTF